MSHFYTPRKRREMEKWSIGYRNGNGDGYRNWSIGVKRINSKTFPHFNPFYATGLFHDPLKGGMKWVNTIHKVISTY